MIEFGPPSLNFIKCSTCDAQMDIYTLNEHLCSSKKSDQKQLLNSLTKILGADNQHEDDDIIPSIQSNTRKGSLQDINFRRILRKIKGGSTDENNLNMLPPSLDDDSSVHSSTTASSVLMTPRLTQKERLYEEQDVEQEHSDNKNLVKNSGFEDNKEHDLSLAEKYKKPFNSVLDDHIVRMYERQITNKCSLCSEDISYTSLVMTKNGDCYHNDCYCCTLCQKTFSPSNPFKLYKGKMYCAQDYQVMSSRSVRNLISTEENSEEASAKTRSSHKCKKKLEDSNYKSYKDRIYNKTDFDGLILPKCQGCLKSIEGKAMSAADGKLQGKWHVECFRCQECHISFPENKFYVHQNLPYCKKHYHQLNNSLCKQCCKPVEGLCAYIPKHNWRYHPQCFKCKACHKHLQDTYFIYRSSLYCSDHIKKQQHRDCGNLISKWSKQLRDTL